MSPNIKTPTTSPPAIPNRFENRVNRGAFPPAMEVALGKLKKGGKVRVLTPSRYFHGEQGGGMIAPYTPVLLEIELVDIKKSNK